MARGLVRGLGVAAGVGAVAAGAVFAAQRAVARRGRVRPDPDAGTALLPRFDREHRLVSHDGGVINVIERGQGPPILFSHGVTLSARTWVKQMEVLPALGFRVLAFDHRGHGASIVGEHGYTLDTLAWDVRTVLEGLDLRDAVVVGHSLGGVATQSFCVRFPEVAAERVAGVVLLSTLARTPLAASRRWAWFLDRIGERLPDASGVLAARDLGFAITRFGFGRSPAPSHVEMTREMILACDPQTRRAAPGSLIGLDLIPELVHVRVPTLVIVGTADLLTPPAESRRIARAIPGARLELVEGAGHMVMLERAEVLDELVADFARSVRQAPVETATGSAASPRPS
ncbi:MAG: alpha/beta fold hydrolase [Actinobacteria bacterium]|nr:alpha/beta fold hydrolase [Actinomycetota bacterium]